jgi:hypothetical protein
LLTAMIKLEDKVTRQADALKAQQAKIEHRIRSGNRVSSAGARFAMIRAPIRVGVRRRPAAAHSGAIRCCGTPALAGGAGGPMIPAALRIFVCTEPIDMRLGSGWRSIRRAGRCSCLPIARPPG